MPRSNGIQTLEALERQGAKAAVIVLTAFPNRQYRERCLQAGAAYFFDKATEFERVAEVLRQLESDRGGGTLFCPPARGAAV
jgi:DNA-binding NarL/FixJ family response regulator